MHSPKAWNGTDSVLLQIIQVFRFTCKQDIVSVHISHIARRCCIPFHHEPPFRSGGSIQTVLFRLILLWRIFCTYVLTESGIMCIVIHIMWRFSFHPLLLCPYPAFTVEERFRKIRADNLCPCPAATVQKTPGLRPVFPVSVSIIFHPVCPDPGRTRLHLILNSFTLCSLIPSPVAPVSPI